MTVSILYPSITFIYGVGPRKLFSKLQTTVHPSNNAFRPQHAFERNIRELEISGLSKFQPCTTSGGRKNVPKPKRRKTKTLNDRLPLKNWSYRPQSLATHVSDYPQHLMFRRRTTFFSGFFRSRKFVFRSFGHMTHMITCDHNMII